MVCCLVYYGMCFYTAVPNFIFVLTFPSYHHHHHHHRNLFRENFSHDIDEREYGEYKSLEDLITNALPDVAKLEKIPQSVS